jgi:CBS domain-containing protein
MAKYVDEIMNKELFTVRGQESASDALGYLLGLDITSAAVLGPRGRAIGVVSIRDLVKPNHGDTAEECMSTEVDQIEATTTIEDAARRLAEHDRRHLVVVDEAGAAVGMVSAGDLIRGLLGMPAKHPPAFPHYDRTSGLCWTDDAELCHERLSAAPDGPGVLVLKHGGKRVREQIVWAEGVQNVRTRLAEMLDMPDLQTPLLARALGLGGLWFRAARTDNAELRAHATEALQREMASPLRPSAISH